MPNTKLDRVKWKNHMHYGKVVYVILIVVGVIVADILYTTTAPTTPNANKVDVYVVAPFTDTTGLKVVADAALQDAQEAEKIADAAMGEDVEAEGYKSDLREVNIYSISYDEENDDGYGAQSYMVRVMAMEGDVFFVSANQLDVLIAQGGVEPLDAYISDGTIDVNGRDLSKVTFDEHVEENETPTGATCVYALQADPMVRGMYSLAEANVTDLYMVIMSYSENKEAAARVIDSMIRQLDDYVIPEENAQ